MLHYLKKRFVFYIVKIVTKFFFKYKKLRLVNKINLKNRYVVNLETQNQIVIENNEVVSNILF